MVGSAPGAEGGAVDLVIDFAVAPGVQGVYHNDIQFMNRRRNNPQSTVKQMCVRMDEKTRRQIEELSDAYGLSMAAIVAKSVQDEWGRAHQRKLIRKKTEQ